MNRSLGPEVWKRIKLAMISGAVGSLVACGGSGQPSHSASATPAADGGVSEKASCGAKGNTEPMTKGDPGGGTHGGGGKSSCG